MSSVNSVLQDRFETTLSILNSNLSSLDSVELSSDLYPDFEEREYEVSSYEADCLFYHGEDQTICKVPDFPVEDVDERRMAAEVGHWLRDQISPELKKHYSVDEFFDRVCQRIIIDVKGEEFPIYDINVENPISTDLTPPEVREKLKSPSISNTHLIPLWNKMNHFAGYKAADFQYEEAAKDSELFQASFERNYEMYNLEEYELEFAKNIINSG